MGKNKDISGIIDKAFSIGMVQKEKEITALANFIRDKNIKNLMEIGTDQGGSFYVLCKASSCDGIKISLDYPKYKFNSIKYSVEHRNREMKKWAKKVYIVSGDSHKEEIKKKIDIILGNKKLDLLFIDADHSYEGVKADYEMYSGFIRDGGYIVFHDISKTLYHIVVGCYVFQFWNELNGEKIEFVDGRKWAGIGVFIKKKKIVHLSHKQRKKPHKIE